AHSARYRYRLRLDPIAPADEALTATLIERIRELLDAWSGGSVIAVDVDAETQAGEPSSPKTRGTKEDELGPRSVAGPRRQPPGGDGAAGGDRARRGSERPRVDAPHPRRRRHGEAARGAAPDAGTAGGEAGPDAGQRRHQAGPVHSGHRLRREGAAANG